MMNEELIKAALLGDVKTVKTLIDKGANIDHCDEQGCTALIHAASKGDIDVVRYLCSLAPKSPNINHRNKEGRTALSMAAMEGHETIIRFLLERNAEFVKDNTSKGPCYFAALNLKFDALRILLTKSNLTSYQLDQLYQDARSGAEAFFLNNKDNNICSALTSLINGIEAASLELLKWPTGLSDDNFDLVIQFLKDGLDRGDSDNNTLLHLLIPQTKLFLIKILLKFGANINKLNSNGETPYQLLIQSGNACLETMGATYKAKHLATEIKALKDLQQKLNDVTNTTEVEVKQSQEITLEALTSSLTKLDYLLLDFEASFNFATLNFNLLVDNEKQFVALELGILVCQSNSKNTQKGLEILKQISRDNSDFVKAKEFISKFEKLEQETPSLEHEPEQPQTEQKSAMESFVELYGETDIKQAQDRQAAKDAANKIADDIDAELKRQASQAQAEIDARINDLFDYIQGTSKKKLNSILYAAGENINVCHPNFEGNTALHLALMKQDKQLVQALLEKDASLDIPNKQGKTAYQLAADMHNPYFEALCSTFKANQIWKEIESKQKTKDLGVWPKIPVPKRPLSEDIGLLAHPPKPMLNQYSRMSNMAIPTRQTTRLSKLEFEHLKQEFQAQLAFAEFNFNLLTLQDKQSCAFVLGSMLAISSKNNAEKQHALEVLNMVQRKTPFYNLAQDLIKRMVQDENNSLTNYFNSMQSLTDHQILDAMVSEDLEDLEPQQPVKPVEQPVAKVEAEQTTKVSAPSVSDLDKQMEDVIDELLFGDMLNDTSTAASAKPASIPVKPKPDSQDQDKNNAPAKKSNSLSLM